MGCEDFRSPVVDGHNGEATSDGIHAGELVHCVHLWNRKLKKNEQGASLIAGSLTFKWVPEEFYLQEDGFLNLPK